MYMLSHYRTKLSSALKVFQTSRLTDSYQTRPLYSIPILAPLVEHIMKLLSNR